MKSNLTVFKIGGQVLEDAPALTQFLKSFAAWPEPKILVHGGGKKATELAQRLGLEPQIIDGRRVTDANMLEIAQMVYGGLYNKTIVALLQALGVNALGLSGADAGCILAHKRPPEPVDFGLVGDIAQINVQRLHWFLESDLVPVFCALTHDGQGQILNTNADTIATQLAVALSRLFVTELIVCFEKNGVLKNAKDERSVIPHLTWADFKTYQAQKIITDGMIPKLENAFHALRAGVQQVRITHFSQLEQGTKISLE